MPIKVFFWNTHSLHISDELSFCNFFLVHVYPKLEGKIGFEPTFEGFADPAVATPAHFPNKVGRPTLQFSLPF